MFNLMDKSLIYTVTTAIAAGIVIGSAFASNKSTSKASSLIITSIENQYNTLVFGVDFVQNGAIVDHREVSSAEAKAQFSNYCPRIRFAPGALREE